MLDLELLNKNDKTTKIICSYNFVTIKVISIVSIDRYYVKGLSRKVDEISFKISSSKLERLLRFSF